MSEAIDHSSHVPLYVQIMRYLTEEIEKGTYGEGEQIPPETALAAEFGVSRITVTNAIQRLVQDGTLYRLRGRGTYVSAKKKLEHRLSSLISFTDEMHSRGFTPHNLIVEHALTKPPDRVRAGLGLNPDALTWKLKRVRYADDEPMAIQTSYLPERLFPGLSREKLENRSLYQFLQAEYGIQMEEAEERYNVIIIQKEEEAKMLNVSRESPALFCLRISCLQANIKFEYTESILRGDRYILSVKIK